MRTRMPTAREQGSQQHWQSQSHSIHISRHERRTQCTRAPTRSASYGVNWLNLSRSCIQLDVHTFRALQRAASHSLDFQRCTVDNAHLLQNHVQNMVTQSKSRELCTLLCVHIQFVISADGAFGCPPHPAACVRSSCSPLCPPIH